MSVIHYNQQKFHYWKIPDILERLSLVFGNEHVALFGGSVRDLHFGEYISDFDIIVNGIGLCEGIVKEHVCQLAEDLWGPFPQVVVFENYEQSNFPGVKRVYKIDTHIDVIEVATYKPLPEVIEYNCPFSLSHCWYIPGRGKFEHGKRFEENLMVVNENVIVDAANRDKYLYKFSNKYPRASIMHTRW